MSSMAICSFYISDSFLNIPSQQICPEKYLYTLVWHQFLSTAPSAAKSVGLSVGRATLRCRPRTDDSIAIASIARV